MTDASDFDFALAQLSAPCSRCNLPIDGARVRTAQHVYHPACYDAIHVDPVAEAEARRVKADGDRNWSVQ